MPSQASMKIQPRVMETIFVGAAMKQVSTAIMDRDAPVCARHMRSIDDLLLFIEDNDVECAVVDQSLPTESRGLKLVLLAGVNKVKHLIVVAPPGSRAEISSVEGVHQVLHSPATAQQIIEAVLDHANTSGSTRASATVTGNLPAAPAAMPETVPDGFAATVSNCRKAVVAVINEARCKPPLQHWAAFIKCFALRPVVAAIASTFLLLGTISVLSLASGGFVMPGQSSGMQAMTVSSQGNPDALMAQTGQATQPLRQTLPVLAAAELSRRNAEFRLQISRRTIDLEILQQQELRREFVAHIALLKSIAGELTSADDNSKPRQSGGSAASDRQDRAAVLQNELVLQELEVGKINKFLTYLNLLKSGINLTDTSRLKLADMSSSLMPE